MPNPRSLQQENLAQREAQAPQLESRPGSLLLEKSPCSSEDPAQPKVNRIIKKQNMIQMDLFTKPKQTQRNQTVF